MLVNSPAQLANCIADRRTRLKKSQAATAKHAGIKQNTVSNFERHPGSTKLETLFSILSSLELELHVQPKEEAARNTNWTEQW